MDTGEVAEAASARLLERREELARTVTQRLYDELPELMDRYGAAGREKCLQDMRYNLEHLAPGVALRDPGLFAGYVKWLRNMLGSRGIPTAEVRRSLELMRDAVREELPPAEADVVAECIEAGVRELVE
jgi:hypothetical protein